MALGTFDLHQRLVIAPLYRTPSIGKSMLMNEALGGWQVTGIYTVRTGAPFSYFDTTNNNSGYQVARYNPASGQTISQHSFTKTPSGVNGGGSPTAMSAQPSVSGEAPDPANGYPANPALYNAQTQTDLISDWGPFPSTMVARNSFRGPGA